LFGKEDRRKPVIFQPHTPAVLRINDTNTKAIHGQFQTEFILTDGVDVKVFVFDFLDKPELFGDCPQDFFIFLSRVPELPF
jgi:hypothetical protein